MEEAKWYIAHTFSGYENKVASDLRIKVENQNLTDMIQDIRIPTETVVEVKEDGTKKEIERKLSLPPFVVKKYTSASRKFDTEFLKKQVMRVPVLDLSIKQGKITDWEALYSFVLDSLSKN